MEIEYVLNELNKLITRYGRSNYMHKDDLMDFLVRINEEIEKEKKKEVAQKEVKSNGKME